MTTSKKSVDFRGARGSNTGDQFHELWALQQVLDLLRPETDLKAVGVEGVKTEMPSQNVDEPSWDGVDCALYYGGTTIENADRIEFVQLKYSAANPETNWSVARLTANTAKKGNNSVIRKMADDFKSAKVRMKQGSPLKIRLISNQGLSVELKKVLEERWSGPPENAAIDQAIRDDLLRLNAATGLNVTEFQTFLETLDFSECGSSSRFAIREKVVATIADLLGDDVSSDVRDLQLRIRELMLPERSNEIVTEKNILLWFGLSSREGLFPCPPDIHIPEHAIVRSATDEVVRLLEKGERLVLVHGEGGCGKTTLMLQIADSLPDGSATVFFDCFGGGRYIHTDDKRHLPENAFTHLANELAAALRLPLFIPRSKQYPATIKSFLAKLYSAGEALKQIASKGILLIIVDAADNAVAAANRTSPPERSFVYELFGASLSALPKNVRFITSCRSDPARRASLQLPPQTPGIICPPFTLPESRQHLEVSFPAPSDDLVEQFHNLSNKNPRVQAYAISVADGDKARLLEALLPGGKTLPDVLRASFDNALKKLGQSRIFENLIGALAFLPAPIAVPSITRIAGCTEETVRDFAIDLAPGLRLHDNAITIADEDFDAFIKDTGSANRNAIIADIAEDFIANLKVDPYSSIHVADALINSGRARDVLSVIERDPQAAAIGDPIVRRQVQVRRLKLSLASCKEAGPTIDALKTILISAEAERDESTLNEVLEKELDLSVEFAGSSLRRAILLDRERVEEHGSFLAQDAVRAIRTGNRVTAREQLYFYDAWLKRRQKVKEEELENGWAVTDLDISARVETILELAGPKTALRDLMGWSPRTVSLRVSYILVPQLIAAGKKHHLKALLDEGLLSGPWDLLLWVPLAMAGESVNGLTIEKSLRRIRRCFIPQVGAHRGAYSEEGWQENLLDTFVTACELAFKLGVDKQAILKPVNLILEVLEGKQQRHLFASDVNRLNGLLRCWLLKETICGGSAKDDSFIAYVKTLKPEPKTKEQRNNKAQKKRIGIHQTDNQEVERLNRKIQALFPVYSARLEILDCVREKQQITEKHLNKLGSISSHSYDFDYDPDGTSLRNMAAQNVMNLLIVDNITASDLAHRASSLAQGRFGDSFAHRRKKLWAKMRLRESEAEKLVLLVAKAAEDIKGLREASSEKLSAIIDLSRLILPISRDDAKSLFDDAIGIAKDIDQEAYDQIDFVSVLADRARVPELVDRIKIAANIFAFVSGAAERLSGRDEFPWRPAVHALTCVDDAASLAAICRWADDGTAKLDYTLDRFLLTGLQKNIISLEEATSLTMLIDGSHGDLRKEIVSRSAADPQKFKKIIEEVAKEALLFSSQDKRLPLGQEIVDRISQNDISDGEWITKLRDTVSFLRQATSNKPEKATTIRSEMVQRLVKDDDLPKKFIFEPQGNSFTTPDSIAEILQAAKTSGLRHDDRDILNKMRNVSSSPRDRVPFLNAVAGVSEDLIWSRLDLIRDTLALWKGTPAVDRWCRESLPLVLIAHFDAATRWLKGGQSILHHLLDYTGLDVNSRLQIILAGVAQVGEALSSRTLFAIAEEIARTLNKDDAGKQLFWYSERLLNRLPAEDQALYVLADIPNDRTEAIARFLFALMSDIDTRVRWKTAHALRRMAKLGRSDIVKATILQSGRVKDVAFRIPSGPFYFLAAKLWLTISLYRISVETPEALKSCKAQVFDLATSSELPHIGIREYAKRTLLQLASGGAISLTADESTVIEQINTALKGRMTDKKDTYRSFRDPQEKRRFRFDAMDTLPYWYEDILRIFPTVSQDQILDIAERWIVDKWGAGPEAHWWDKEPRKGRYDERRYALWSHSHGSFPIVERYGTHLEWHAMHCVVGELLTTHQILNEDEDEFGSFGYWLRKILLTEPPYWLSDNRGATPLEHRLWLEDSRTDRGWLHSVRRDEFLTEIGAHSQIRTGWIVVEGYYSIHFPKREVNVRINSALVSPKTANSLVCALQTASDPWDFRLPDENDNMQIDEPPYQLLGWLTRIESDMRFDENDPFRYEVRQIRGTPGLKLSEALGLVQKTGNPRTWVCSSTGEAAFLYEAWCDEPSPEDDYYPRRIRSDGWRLWAKADIVRSFFTNEGWDLICEVQIERRLKNEYGRSYDTDEKKKTHDKILLLRADGSIADTKGHIGTWTGLSQATQS